MIMTTKNELRYLQDVFEEIKENGESLEIDNAIELLQGLQTESDRLSELTLDQFLEQNAKLLEVSNGSENEITE